MSVSTRISTTSCRNGNGGQTTTSTPSRFASAAKAAVKPRAVALEPFDFQLPTTSFLPTEPPRRNRGILACQELRQKRPATYHGTGGENGDRRSEERRVGKECRSRWSPY